VGNSGIVAQDAQHKFFRLGVTSIATSDGHMQVMSATMLGPGDCAVIISNSGRTPRPDGRGRHRAQERRHHHRHHRQRLAAGQACAIHLAADHPEGYDRYSPMVSRLLHLLIIDVLATCVALRIRGSGQWCRAPWPASCACHRPIAQQSAQTGHRQSWPAHRHSLLRPG
jgi:RpiR family carbohydrate utilization transcriptional regulator